LPDAARDPEGYLPCHLCLGSVLRLPRVLAARDLLGGGQRYMVAQVPALAFLGVVVCFVVVMTGYNLLSWTDALSFPDGGSPSNFKTGRQGLWADAL
jgi:hypothetical protein